MGSPMAARLSAAPLDVVGFDLSPAVRERSRAAGLTVATTAAATATGADVVVLMLPNSDIVDAVANELVGAGSLRRGALVVDMSSSEPLRTRALAAWLGAEDVRMIDAPVSGGVKGATAGTLTIMAGGPAALVEEYRPLLEHLGHVVRAGDVGSGHAVKALNNLLSATHLLVTSEAMIVAQAFGLDPVVTLSIFNSSSGKSGSTENKWPNFILPGTYDSGFALRLMLKDMKIAADLASRSGVDARLSHDAIEIWSRAAAALDPAADHTEIARWLEEGGEHE